MNIEGAVFLELMVFSASSNVFLSDLWEYLNRNHDLVSFYLVLMNGERYSNWSWRLYLEIVWRKDAMEHEDLAAGCKMVYKVSCGRIYHTRKKMWINCLDICQTHLIWHSTLQEILLVFLKHWPSASWQITVLSFCSWKAVCYSHHQLSLRSFARLLLEIWVLLSSCIVVL